MSEKLLGNLSQHLIRHRRPLAFGLVGLMIFIGVVWLDTALSKSQFSEVFVGESPPPQEAPLTAEQQLELAKEEARQLIDEQRRLANAEANPNETLRAEIESMLNQWVSSWSSKDAGGYLSFYAEDFDTPFGISREEWAGFRIRRIEEPRWIRVQLEQIDFVPLEENVAALSLTQLYATPGYADRTRKHMDLVRGEQGWKIRREDSVETVRTD